LHNSLYTDGSKLIGIQLKGSMDRNQFKLLRQIPQKQNVMYFCTLQLFMNRGDRYEHSRIYFLQRVRVVSTQNLTFMEPCIVVWLVAITNEMQL